jgi:HEAT repeat protein
MNQAHGQFAFTPEELHRMERVDRLAAGADGGVVALADMLDDPSWTVRRSVVAALAAAGTVAIAPLCALLRTRRDSEARVAATVDALSASNGDADAAVLAMRDDPNPAVVADVAQILGRRRTTAGLPALVALTHHPDDNVAVAAIEALGRIGGRAAVDALVEAVGSGNFFRTFPAIDVLGRSGDPRAIGPLTALLDAPQYAAEAARALGRTGDPAAVAPLVGLLSHSAGATVRIAALALQDLQQRNAERFGDAGRGEEVMRKAGRDTAIVRHLLRAIPDGDSAERIAICFVLGALRDPSTAPALSELLEGPAPVAAAATEALRRLGPEATAPVLQGLRSADSAKRRALLPLVSRVSAAPDVVACLSDADPDVRALACEALGRVGAIPAVGALFPLLADTNTRVAFAALGAIQALGGRETETLALRAAHGPDARVRRCAMRILAYFGFSSALDTLLGALADDDERVREAAIQGLPLVEEPRALAALLAAAKDPDTHTRGVAMRALGQTSGDLRVSAYLLKGLGDTDPWVRYYACQALGRLAFEPAVDAIIRLLADPAGQVRVAAVEALSCLKGPRALQALKAAVSDAEIDIQRAALVGLGVAGQPESLPVILAATQVADPATRLVALSALVSFESSDVLRALVRAATDADESVRSAAIGFLSTTADRGATAALVALLPRASSVEQIVAALSVAVDGRVEGLARALDDADDEIASALTSALARLQRADATAALIGTMSSRNSRARKAAATTLAGIGSRDALAVLRTAATDDPEPEVRRICALLLAR